MPAAMAPGGGGPAPKVTVKVKPVGPGPKLRLTSGSLLSNTLNTPHLGVVPKPKTIGQINATIKAAKPSAPARAPRVGGNGAFRGLYPGVIKPPKFIGGSLGILGRLGNEIVHLAPNTLEGVIGLGGAVVHDVTHGGILHDITDPLGTGRTASGQQTFQTPGDTAVQSALSSAVHSDPVYQAVTKGSLKPFAQNPLGTLLDAAGAYGIVGKGAGAIARSGALGEEARAAASMAREPAHVPLMGESSNVSTHKLENAVGARSRSYSPNIFTKLVQQANEARGPSRTRSMLIDQQLRHSVATDHAAEQGARQAEVKAIIKADKKIKPKGAEANVARFVIPYGTAGTGEIRTMLEQARANIVNNPETAGVTAQTAKAAVEHIDKALAKPSLDEAALLKAAGGAHEIQNVLDAKQAQLGMMDTSKLENAVRKQYLLQQPDFHLIQKPTADPQLLGKVKDAATVVRNSQAELDAAKADAAASERAHSVIGKHVNSTLGRLPVKYQGLKGSDIVPGSSADRLVSHLYDERQMVQDSRPIAKAEGKDAIKATTAALKDALSAHRAALREVKAKPLKGTMIEDYGVPAITKKAHPQYGLHLRPVTEADYQARLAQEPAGFQPTYLSERNLLRDRVQELKAAASDNTPHLAEQGRAALTGEAAKVGDLNPGWAGVVRSHLNTANMISIAREMQGFADRYLGQGHARLQDAQREAADVSSATGTKMTTVQWKGEFHNAPTAALNELERQFKADHPGKGWKVLTKPNAAFRNTVLAMSTKLPIMHSIENTSRTALMEGPLAPLRAPLDVARGMAITRAAKAAGPEAEARLKAITTPGSLSHSSSGAVGEDAGKLAIEQAPVREAAQRFVNAAAAVPHGIIQIQRSLERPAQFAALGAHSRQLLQEWGHSWMEANTVVSKYATDVARGLADPAEAQRAAEFMHNTMGQYNAFTALTRNTLRFVPFGSWYANAAKLVMVTLPRDHPLFDALLQDVHQAMAPQWNAQHKGLPADMQTSLNVGPNSWLDIGKFTPIGVQPPTLAGVESTASQLALPWVASPALAALAGKGPFMSDLYGPNTPFTKNIQPFTPQANLVGLEQLAEEFGGPLNDISRMIYGHGGTFYPASTPLLHLAGIGPADIKKGSRNNQRGFLKLPPALDKVLDPFHPTTLKSAGGAVNLKGVEGGPPSVVGKLPNKPEGIAPTIEGRG